MLRDGKAADEALGQAGQGGGDHLGQDAGPLAAAQDQQADRSGLVQEGIGCSLLGGDGGAHRHAGMDQFGDQAGVDVTDLGERGGDARHPAGQQAVGAAQHGVLFVHHRRNSRQRGRDHGRHRGIAAKAHHHGGADTGQQRAGLEHAETEFGDTAQLGHRAPAGDAAGGDAVGFQLAQRAAVGGAAPVGDQGQTIAALQQGAGQGLGGEDVAAGTAGGQGDEGRAHASMPSRP